MAVHKIKQGSTELEQLTVKAGDPAVAVDLTNATTVEIVMREVGASVNYLTKACVVVSAAAGTITWDPVDAVSSGVDGFSVSGLYDFNVKVTWNDGDITYHPDDGWEKYHVQDNLE